MESKFSEEQLIHYVDRIGLPREILDPKYPRDIELLRRVHVHQISTFPYSNLALHYNPGHRNDLDPQALYARFMSGFGHGGYCIDTVIFFREVLRALGYQAYTVGAKIRLRDQNGVPHGEFISYVHCVNIVTFESGEKYVCDVGFGGDGPTVPLPMREGVVVQNLGSQQVRLVYQALPNASALDRQLKWVYQYRNGPEKPWNSYYAFADFEWFDVDLAMANYWISTAPDSFQVQHVILVKFLRGKQPMETGEAHETIIGKRMMYDGIIKENMGGKTHLLQTCQTESERIEALKTWFQIYLNNEEVAAMQGWGSELK